MVVPNNMDAVTWLPKHLEDHGTHTNPTQEAFWACVQ